MSLVRAIYKRSGEACYVNMDFVVDVFDNGSEMLAYTWDADRGGYVISRHDFDAYLKKEGGEDGE